MSIPIEHVIVESGGLRLHTLQAGPADGPVAILLHGFPEFSGGWRAQIPALAQAGLRVVAPDQRGYNLSDKPRGVKNYAIEHLAGDVLGLIDALGAERVYLAGHDWGAAVAWETALRYPDRITRLAILNVPHPDIMVRFLVSSPRQMLKSWYIFYFQIPGLPEWQFRRRNFAVLRGMLRSSARAGTFSKDALDDYVRAWGQPGALHAMLNWYRAAVRINARRAWSPRHAPRRVSTPTLMLWGVKDVALSVDMAQPSIDLCDQGELVLYPQATHWVQHDEAEAVNQRLLAWFKP